MKIKFYSKLFSLVCAVLVILAATQPTLAAKTAKGTKATKKVQKIIKKSVPVKSAKTLKTVKTKAKANKQKQADKPQTNASSTNNTAPTNNAQTAPKSKTVMVNNSPAGFLPVNMPAMVGDTVQFQNDSDLPMWPAAGPHPSHEFYPEFDAREPIAPGESWSFSFKRAGSWRYHDHLNPNHTGTILVCTGEKDCAEKFNSGNF